MVSSQGGNVTQVKEEGVFYDCTHYRPRSEVHRAWVQLLLNAVKLISDSEAESYEGGASGAVHL
jgi:hypothetical protein